MATVESTLKLNDQMSKTFNAVSKSVENFTSAANSAEQKTKDFKTNADNVGNTRGFESVEGQVVSLNSALDILNKTMNIFKSALGYVQESINLFEVRQTAQTALQTVLKNQGYAIDNYNELLDIADEISSKTTISSTTLLAGFGELATYVSDFEALKAAIPTFTDFAVGLANANPKMTQAELLNTATGFGKALQGQYALLTMKGFEVSEAQKEIIKNGTDMERVAIITEIVGGSYQGLAEIVAATPVGQIELLANQTKKLKEAVGKGLYPIYFKFHHLVAEILNPALAILGNNLEIVIPIVAALGTTILVAITKATVAMGALTKATAIFTSTVGLIATPVVAVIAAFAAVAAGIAYLYETNEDFAAAIDFIWNDIKTIILDIVTPIVNAFTYVYNQVVKVFDAIWNKIKGVAESVGIVFESPVDAVVFLFYGMVYGVQNLFAGLYNRIAETAEFVGNCFKHPLDTVQRLFLDAFSAILKIISPVAGVLGKLLGVDVSGAIAGYQSAVSSLRSSIPAGIQLGRMDVGNTLADAQRKVSEFQASRAGKAAEQASAADKAVESLEDALVNGAGGKALRTQNDKDLITDEQIKTLTELAAQKYKFQYQQTKQNINVVQNNNVSSNVDVNSMLRTMADTLEDAYDGRLDMVEVSV